MTTSAIGIVLFALQSDINLNNGAVSFLLNTCDFIFQDIESVLKASDSLIKNKKIKKIFEVDHFQYHICYCVYTFNEF